MLAFVYQLIQTLLLLYMLTLLGRLVLDWIQVFSRDWTPRGVLLVVANVVYALTDPPLRFLRRYIKPLPLGQIQLDLSFLVLFIAVNIAQIVVVPAIFRMLV